MNLVTSSRIGIGTQGLPILACGPLQFAQPLNIAQRILVRGPAVYQSLIPIVFW